MAQDKAMRVTQASLKAQARDLNMDYSYSPAWQEHRVNLKIADGGTADTAYYTSDAEDARDTMSYMARERDARIRDIVKRPVVVELW